MVAYVARHLLVEVPWKRVQFHDINEYPMNEHCPEATQKKAEVLLYAWLIKEHGYQFNKNRVTFDADPKASLAAIMGDGDQPSELNNKWGRYQFFRRERPAPNHPDYLPINLQASQQILKVTAAARAAVVWNGVIISQTADRAAGNGFDRANRASFLALREYFGELNNPAFDSVQLPPTAALDQPLQEAITPYSLLPIEGQYQPLRGYTSIAGLAITHILEQQNAIGSMSLPKPGVSSGNIQPWSTK